MFYADLHIHSKYSRATSRDCDLEHMAYWAVRKGVSVLGTGDFTHPVWFDEIKNKLVPAEPGLFRLNPQSQQQVDQWLIEAGCGQSTTPTKHMMGELSEGVSRGISGCGAVRFMLQVEISTIYKKDDKTRKVHHLIYAPDLDSAQKINQSLARIGNIASDGRPILGLDSRHLLEITLDAGPGCYLIPAHIWTPWFAVLGSKSGFDTIEHCYGDLTPNIFAVETGLSSDPPMNWRLSMLDRYTLVSNSDAHSPPKIGREACAFDTAMDYFAMRRALETGHGYHGTVEFFPEEGKYHLDGHRKCGVCLTPAETQRNDGRCPVCGKPVTLGVMHRVNELADRHHPAPDPPSAPVMPSDKTNPKQVRPAEGDSQATSNDVVEASDQATHKTHHDTPTVANSRVDYRSLIPLEEVIAEIEGVGPKSKRVQHKYECVISQIGSELFILEQAPLEEVQRGGGTLLAEAISRMRQGRVIRQSGYDGEYGKICLFTHEERLRGSAVSLLFSTPEGDSTSNDPTALVLPPAKKSKKNKTQRTTKPAVKKRVSNKEKGKAILDGLDSEQRVAAQIVDGPLLIVAGPGTGKTRTLTHRIAHIIHHHKIRPQCCLAITFTRRAADELADRLAALVPHPGDPVPVMTFHGLGLFILSQYGAFLGLPDQIRVANEAQRVELLREVLSVSERQAKRWFNRFSQLSRAPAGMKTDKSEGVEFDDAECHEARRQYQQALRARGLVDFDDLLTLPVQLLQAHPELAQHYQTRFPWISVDEYQDIDPMQYQLIRLLTPTEGNLCVIGDPDQAIYGFRGSDVGFFQRFERDNPSAKTVYLTRNYRSTRPIVDASLQLIAPSSLVANRQLVSQVQGTQLMQIHRCSTDRAEAEFVVHRIERLIGGSTFFSMDSGRVESHEGEELSFADFAVLYRTDAQADALVEALARSGMPYQKRSHHGLADQPTVQAIIGAMQGLVEAEGLSVSQCLEQAAAEVPVEGDVEAGVCLHSLRLLADRYRDDLGGFLSALALGVDADLWDPRADRVSLLTLHAAKGLQFPVVFMVGCEDGLLPLRWGAGDETDLAEERRLFFVGMTRAQHRLILTHAGKRRWRGKAVIMPISPFVQDIQQQLLDRHEHHPQPKVVPQHEQGLLFPSKP